MAKDLNKLQIIGRLGKDPEMRFTPNGAPVATFSVAVGRSWKDAQGELKEETEWFSVVVWNKLAEICNQYLSKGARAYFEGRLQTRSWDDTVSGEKKYRTEMVAEDMIILDSRRKDDDEAPSRPAPRQASSESARREWGPDVGGDDIPF
jgi:single-strand DNA-binding protein